MQQTLLFLWLVGAALYAVITLTSAPSPTASVGSDDFKRREANLLLPSRQQLTSRYQTFKHTRRARLRTRRCRNQPRSITVPPVGPAHRLWGESLRGAPVHGGPSVSSATIGYRSTRRAYSCQRQILRGDATGPSTES
jgi:hypothetical protein